MASTSSKEESTTTWISTSDLMASLIFILLVILLNLVVKNKSEQLREQRLQVKLSAPYRTRSLILQGMKDHLVKNGIKVEVIVDQGVMRFPEESIRFEAAKARPDESKLENLGLIAQSLQQVLSCFSRQKRDPHFGELRPTWCGEVARNASFQCPQELLDSEAKIESVFIEGHTDSTLVKSGVGYVDNLALSSARATTVMRMLSRCESGLEVLFNSSHQPLLAASGYAALRPWIADRPDDPRNRRIDIRIVMESPQAATREEYETF